MKAKYFHFYEHKIKCFLHEVRVLACVVLVLSLPARHQRPRAATQQVDHRWVGRGEAGLPVRHNPALLLHHSSSR